MALHRTSIKSLSKKKKIEGQLFICTLSLPHIFGSDLEDFYSHGKVQFKNGRIRVVIRKQSAQLSIDNWTSAFMIYMNIIF